MSSSSTKFSHGDYTVGWVCALPKEQTAATAMLDRRHPDLPKPPTDHNTYTLGTVGSHNVVIACLPMGKYGTNSAAVVATRMLDTFPCIKFGLMVGIGGGIPPKVRLGDVVVSTPTKKYPGVVQWDFGKAEKGGHFERIGALNNPPTQLLTALSKLETERETKGSQIPRYLDELAKMFPLLVPKYIKSDSLKDPLLSSKGLRDDREGWLAFLSMIWAMIWAAIVSLFKFLVGQAFAPGHPVAENGVVEGGQKAPRDMEVHFGLIASGNQVVKDAVFRDEINRQMEGNVLCLEMEAAGLSDDFPCLVIRGICDYADSGKTKEWQWHAAAVAAAFAKELLSVVPAHEVSQMENAKSKL
jgi:nucleoside phosphorylase